MHIFTNIKIASNCKSSFSIGNSSLKHLKATLVVVPSHLVDQWAEEAAKFLPIYSQQIVKIKHLSRILIKVFEAQVDVQQR